MTENEAIKELQSYIPKDNGLNDKDIEAFNMAIQALENQENMWQILEGLKRYSAIGTIEEFKSLKEKSEAKKPISISKIDSIGNALVECPICRAKSDYDTKSIKNGHCWKCGQKLDWSE